MDRWQKATEWPLTVLALVFLGAYAWPILDTGIVPEAEKLCEVVVWLTWAVFVLDYGVRLLLAEQRVPWVMSHLLDLAVILLPMLRPLRLLRLVTMIRVLNKTAVAGLRGRVGLYLSAGSGLLALVAALAVLDAERDAAGANIEDLGDALWWAAATMSTAGYGDQFPVTTTGRLVGVGLMVAGIALLGTVTATVASWLVERVANVSASSTMTDDDEHEELRREVARLRAQLDELGWPQPQKERGRT